MIRSIERMKQLIAKNNLDADAPYQARVRARLRKCGCAARLSGDDAWRLCLEAGDCSWTPWSGTSAWVTPLPAPPDEGAQ